MSLTQPAVDSHSSYLFLSQWSVYMSAPSAGQEKHCKASFLSMWLDPLEHVGHKSQIFA